MMIHSHEAINLKTHDEHLPEITYRISADYGRVEVARSLSSFNDDLFGRTMNICARMNHLAQANGLVIGSGLYQLVKQLKFTKTTYTFKRADNLRIGINKTYPIYHVID
jgi:class 3 adenylate cyclase